VVTKEIFFKRISPQITALEVVREVVGNIGNCFNPNPKPKTKTIFFINYYKLTRLSFGQRLSL